MTTLVRAAGGLVWRPSGDGVEVCLVHRSRYDDWSLPKGKLEPGEHPLAAAVREVAEETEICGVPQLRMPSVRYVMRDGLPKLVDFWSMRAVDTREFHPNAEVDGLRWSPVDAALDTLSYPHDVQVLAHFAALPPVTAVLTLARHAKAGKRGTWPGPDSARPLDEVGVAQARALAPLLALAAPCRLVSAAPRRCVQTLQPLAGLLDLPVEIDSAFEEPQPGQHPDEKALAAAARLVQLAASGWATAVCSQGKVIPGALRLLTGQDPGDFYTPKGSGWLLAFAGERLLGADRL